jgi:hypothetical protein
MQSKMPAPTDQGAVAFHVSASDLSWPNALALRAHVDERLKGGFGGGADRIYGLKSRLRGRRVGKGFEAESRGGRRGLVLMRMGVGVAHGGLIQS